MSSSYATPRDYATSTLTRGEDIELCLFSLGIGSQGRAETIEEIVEDINSLVDMGV